MIVMTRDSTRVLTLFALLLTLMCMAWWWCHRCGCFSSGISFIAPVFVKRLWGASYHLSRHTAFKVCHSCFVLLFYHHLFCSLTWEMTIKEQQECWVLLRKRSLWLRSVFQISRLNWHFLLQRSRFLLSFTSRVERTCVPKLLLLRSSCILYFR